MAGLREKIKGEVEKVNGATFQYDRRSISRIDLPGDETEDEARERLREIKEEAPKEDLCIRCLDNSEGRIKTSVTGLSSCPVCGTPNLNYKGE